MWGAGFYPVLIFCFHSFPFPMALPDPKAPFLPLVNFRLYCCCWVLCVITPCACMLWEQGTHASVPLWRSEDNCGVSSVSRFTWVLGSSSIQLTASTFILGSILPAHPSSHFKPSNLSTTGFCYPLILSSPKISPISCYDF